MEAVVLLFVVVLVLTYAGAWVLAFAAILALLNVLPWWVIAIGVAWLLLRPEMESERRIRASRIEVDQILRERGGV